MRADLVTAARVGQVIRRLVSLPASCWLHVGAVTVVIVGVAVIAAAVFILIGINCS